MRVSDSAGWLSLLQTCLGEGKGGEKGGLVTPLSFSLDFCQTRILLECPIDLSALLLFLPSALPSDVDQQRPDSLSLQHANSDTLPSSSSRSSPARARDHRQDLLQAGRKRPRHEDGAREQRDYYRIVHGQYFLDAAPWYKTPNLNAVDVTSLNVVLVSNPVAMLGLPLLVRNPDFTAKVCFPHCIDYTFQTLITLPCSHYTGCSAYLSASLSNAK